MGFKREKRALTVWERRDVQILLLLLLLTRVQLRAKHQRERFRARKETINQVFDVFYLLFSGSGGGRRGGLGQSAEGEMLII